MTVGDLIEALKVFHPDLPVLVGGFDECGLTAAPKPKKVRLTAYETPYSEFDIISDWNNTETCVGEGVVLG